MKKLENRLVVVFGILFIIINLIGYLFNIDILKISVRENNGYTIYFVSVYISLLLTLIYCIIYKIIKK